ncbi:MAG: hypothetical protein WBE70_02395 [Candidatus Acidiferrum sp.]
MSAWLVAVTWTIAGEGRSAGAVYSPSEEIVPVDVLPFGRPFTLQVTAVLVALVTVAVNVCEFPSNTEALGGVIVTTMDGGGEGGGGGGFVTLPVLPPPQPWTHAATASKTTQCKAAGGTTEQFLCSSNSFPFAAFCLRGRMLVGMQAKGQRKHETSFDRGTGDMISEGPS